LVFIRIASDVISTRDCSGSRKSPAWSTSSLVKNRWNNILFWPIKAQRDFTGGGCINKSFFRFRNWFESEV